MHIEREEHRTADATQPVASLYLDDAPRRLSLMACAEPESVQLIYLDPPFMTGNRFGVRAHDGRLHDAYRDDLDSAAYWTMMEAALRSCHALLKPEGSLYLHCDYRTSARFRVLLDGIFRPQHFVNEIIWHYKSGGRAKAHFSRKHDNILFYRKSRQVFFDISAVGKPRGATRVNHMKRDVGPDGKVSYSIRSAGKTYVYDEDTPVYPSDVWSDINHLQQRDPERCGYATQKPVALLERIVLASSAKGDLVVDPFAGSGTTGIAATQNGRRFIGIDTSPQAIRVARRRFVGANTPLSLHLANADIAATPHFERLGRSLVIQTPDEADWDYVAVGLMRDDVFSVQAQAFAPFADATLLPLDGANAILAADQSGRICATTLVD